MQTDLSNQLEALITEGKRRSRKGIVFLIPLGVVTALIGLSVGTWSFHEADQRAKQAAKLAEAQAALRNAQTAEQQAKIAEQQARVVSLQVNQLIASGAQQAHIGHFSAATRSYEAALKLDPENTVALQLDGYLQFREGNIDQAVSLLRHAVASNPKDPWSRYNFALALSGSGDIDAAIDQVQKLIAIAPDFKEIILSDPQFIRLRKTSQLKKLLESEDRTR